MGVMPEKNVLVAFDEDKCTVLHPNGTLESVRWEDLLTVEVHTNDSGPWGTDVWWVLTGTSSQCRYPGGATGEQTLLTRLQTLEGFDNQALIDAMLCTDNAEFLCWSRADAR